MNAIDAVNNFKAVVSEKRWIQNAWHKQIDGREYLCLAAAWGKPGDITSVSECPVNVLPLWLFELMPTLNDNIAGTDVPWLFEGFARRAEKMVTLSPDAWERVRTQFLIGVIQQAVRTAETSQQDKEAAVWKRVVSACEGVTAAIASGDAEALAAAEAAAGAAAGAARAAGAAAAAAAARAAAGAAAWAAWAAAAARAARAAAAARAARAAGAAAAAAAARAAAAAGAAAAAAAARAAAGAAAGAAWHDIAEVLFKAIDAEIAAL